MGRDINKTIDTPGAVYHIHSFPDTVQLPSTRRKDWRQWLDPAWCWWDKTHKTSGHGQKSCYRYFTCIVTRTTIPYYATYLYNYTSSYNTVMYGNQNRPHTCTTGVHAVETVDCSVDTGRVKSLSIRQLVLYTRQQRGQESAYRVRTKHHIWSSCNLQDMYKPLVDLWQALLTASYPGFNPIHPIENSLKKQKPYTKV